MTKLNIRMLLTLIGVSVVTAGVLYLTFDWQTLSYIKSLRLWAVFAAFGLLAVGMYFDGSRLVRMGKLADVNIGLGQALQVVFGNYFLALLTPGSAGGPVAQVLFLRKAGVAAGTATVLTMVRTLLSIFVLVLCLPAVLYYDRDLLPGFSNKLLVSIAIAIISICFCGFYLLRSQYLNRLINKAATCFPAYAPKIGRVYQDLGAAVKLLGRSYWGMLIVFLETFLSLLALYSIVPVLFMGMGAEVSWIPVLGRLVLLNFILYFAPTPGGTGVAEGGFILLLSSMFPQSMVGIAAILWRVLAEYVPFLVGLICSLRTFGFQYLQEKQLLQTGEGSNQI